MKNPLGICKNCGYIGPILGISVSGEGTRTFLVDCFGSCPCCMQQAQYIDGGYEIIDGALRVIQDAKLNKSDLELLKKTLSDALSNNVKNIEKKLIKLGRQFLPIATYAAQQVKANGLAVALILLQQACSQNLSVERKAPIINNYYFSTPKIYEDKKLEEQDNKGWGQTKDLRDA